MDASSFRDNCVKFEKDASTFLERFRNKLEELEEDRSVHLSYFDTYPWPPEEYHLRQKTGNPFPREPHEYARLHGNFRSTPRTAPDRLFDQPLVAPGASTLVSKGSQQQAAQEKQSSTVYQTQADLNRAQLFGLAPIKRSLRPVEQGVDSQPSKERSMDDASPTAAQDEAPLQSLEMKRTSSVDNTQYNTIHEERDKSPLVSDATTSESLSPAVLTEMEISRRITGLESIFQAIHEFSEQSLEALQRIRFILGSYSEQLGDSASALVACAFIEACVHHIGWQNNEPEWRDMAKQDLMRQSSLTDYDSELAEILHELKDAFQLQVLKIVLDILRESLSEAEAEEHNKPPRPQWPSVMEFFEWKAGYTLQECLSDCANIWSERFPPSE